MSSSRPLDLYGSFPVRRPRRLRRNTALRAAVADVRLRPERFILPLFVGAMDSPREVASMPGVRQWPVADALAEVRRLTDLGLNQFLLFGVTPAERKDPVGGHASSPDAPVNRLLSDIRSAPWSGDILLYADLCLCEYTDHGHCGVLDDPGHASAFGFGPGTRRPSPGGGASAPGPGVANDRTLERLAEIAVAQARAGADVVAPSSMMDGQVAALRRALDEQRLCDTAILSYSVKYASSFYGPFRQAGEGGMKFGDRRGYQMDHRRRDEWRIELALDLREGADMVMVKPAATYLDIVRAVREAAPGVPLAAYHVSGEYAMLCAAAERGWLDLDATLRETSESILRAGADLVITYAAERLLR